ncbi:MAG: cell division ATP-binding protein FtsE [Bacillota bacterium]|nr:cell division ATP-binding protein FtsE [Bacillota bacterium]
MIDLKEVVKSYPNGVHAINHLDLHIDQGEFVYIIGQTGSGKSTLIRLLNGEIVPDRGEVIVEGVDVGKLKHSKVPEYRRKIGCIFQDYRLLPKLTVYENIAFALEVIGMPKREIKKRVREILEMVDLKEKERSYPDELSGGQQQRVTIGRAIANHPSLLIADEPTGNLDPEKSMEIVELLERINEKYGTTILMVTHDQVLVDKKKKRTVMLERGFMVYDSMSGGYASTIKVADE